MLHPGRPSSHVSGFSVSDFPDAESRHHGLRMGAGLPSDLHGRHSPPRPTSIPGWAIPAAIGKATPWWWTSRNINDKTWFDMAGDFHSDALHVVERYRMTDHDTIRVPSDHRGFESFHQAVDHQHCFAPAHRSRPAFRVLLRIRTRRSERSVHARGPNLVSRQRRGASREDGRLFRGCPRLRRRRCPTFAGLRTANRICRASMNPRPEARTRGWKYTRRLGKA